MKLDEHMVDLLQALALLVRDGWMVKSFKEEHHLGIVPCIEVSRTFGSRAEFHTFYDTVELWNWILELK